jgi:hypothetical protein
VQRRLRGSKIFRRSNGYLGAAMKRKLLRPKDAGGSMIRMDIRPPEGGVIFCWVPHRAGSILAMARLAAHRDRLRLVPREAPRKLSRCLLSVYLDGTVKMMCWEECHVEREPFTLPLAASAPLSKQCTSAKTLFLNHPYVRLWKLRISASTLLHYGQSKSVCTRRIPSTTVG